MRVFISHSGKDKAAVEALALALREHGIEPWFDGWEIGAGDDIVASINDGLDKAGAGIIVFSRHSRESPWIEAEVSYLTFARIEEGKILIPVMLGEDCYVPPTRRYSGLIETGTTSEARAEGGRPGGSKFSFRDVSPAAFRLDRDRDRGSGRIISRDELLSEIALWVWEVQRETS